MEEPMRAWIVMLGFIIAAGPVPLLAQAGSDIWVIPMKLNTGLVAFGAPRNVTDRAGYDNEPTWSLRGESVYFSSARGDGQNDVWSVEVASGKQTRVTTTSPESEYSPALIAGGQAMTVVRVEKDSAQRLWRFPLDGRTPYVLLSNIQRVAYYAWADDNLVALCVLGNAKTGVPQTFEIADARTGAQTFVAHNVGHTIAKIPGANAVSFVQQDSVQGAMLMRYDLGSRKITTIAPMMPGVQDYAWTPTGRLLSGKDSELFEYSSRT
jgi:dipeptidyl aminopeptidase/acylaminoacyl peptidase